MTQAHLTIVHTSDWHLGHELFGHAREVEHDMFLAWLLDMLDDVGADALLVTGDLYDVANPPNSATSRLYRFIAQAMARRPMMQISMIGGNHDSAARIDLPGALLGDGRLHVVGCVRRVDGAVQIDPLFLPLTDRDDTPRAMLAAVPYCRAADTGAEGLTGLYRSVLDEGERRAGGMPLIVTGHLHVQGGDISAQSERPIVVGGEEAESTALFDERCAYVALGHLHRPQNVKGPAPIRYAGSPFPLSATERDYRHSVTVIEIGDEGCDVREELIPRPCQFHLVPKGGAAPIDEVKAAIAALGRELDPDAQRELWPFVEIAVSADGPQPHLQGDILQAIDGLPMRLTRILRGGTGSNAGGLAPQAQDISEMTPGDVFAALYAQRHPETKAAPAEIAAAFAELVNAAHGEDA